MFGMSGTELAIVFVVALLLLGPTKLPELARSVGKGLRDFRRATDDLRNSVESEIYRMDEEKPPMPPAPQAPESPAGKLAADVAQPAPSPAPIEAAKPAGAAAEPLPARAAPVSPEAGSEKR
jgi:sec-independent protein translocase protein TatB